MNLVRVNYDKIEWEAGREGRLYRGNSQSNFEYKVFESLKKRERPNYWGCLDTFDRGNDDKNRITFYDRIYMGGIYHLGRHLDHLRESRDYPEPFSNFPLFMEIDASRYKDRIFLSTKGEGLVIKGPISIDDITVLFSTHINLLDERMPKNIECRAWIVYLEGKCNRLSRKDLLEKVDENKAMVIQMLKFVTKREERLITVRGDEFEEYFEILRKKLR